MKKAVLLMRPRSFFGANVVNIPAIYLVKKYIGADHITVFTDINLAYFYKQLPWVNHQSEAQSLVTIYQEIEPRTDFLYCMRPSMDSVPLLKLSKGIRQAVGLSLRSKWLNRFYTHHSGCCTNVYRAIAHIQPLVDYLQLRQEVIFYMREAMLALIEQPMIYTAVTRICFMPGAGGGEHKKWGIENYWLLMQQLHRLNSAWRFDFVLGAAEQYERAFLLKRQGQLPFSLHQNLGLKELIKLVENSRLTIANDCGPSHISQCLAKPFIGLYTQPNPEWFFAHAQSCSINAMAADIKNIAVARVYDECLRLLDNSPLKIA